MIRLIELVEGVLHPPIARRVQWQAPDHPYPVSLVLCFKHLQRLLQRQPVVRLTGETFGPELCDWCHPQAN